MRFVTDDVIIIDGPKQKTAIVMIMCRFMPPCRDLVDIDIEQRLLDKLQADQAGFFDGFTKLWGLTFHERYERPCKM